MAQRFNDSYLSTLKPKAKPYKVRDNADVAGFGLQVSTAGTKSFFLAVPVKGKRIYVNLGRYTAPIRESETTTAMKSNLVERREYARTLRAIADQGKDPRKWIEDQNNDHRSGSFEDLLDSYLRSLGGRPSAKHAAQIFDNDIKTAIDPKQPANEVNPEMVTNALRRIVKRGAMTQANRAHSYTHAAFAYGLKFDNDPSSESDLIRFYLSSNPVSAVAKPQPTKQESVGDRALKEQEIKLLWHKLDTYNGMTIDSKRALRLLLITGQRVETVVEAPRSEFDLDAGLWKIPASRMKAKRAHEVPLHSMAIELIQDQMSIHESEMLFPSVKDTTKTMRSNSLSRAVLRFCEREKFTKFVPRDIRRTWKTRAGGIGISKADRDQLQAHAIGGDVSAKHYDRYDYLAEKTAAMTAWCTFLDALLNNANVTPFKTAELE